MSKNEAPNEDERIELIPSASSFWLNQFPDFEFKVEPCKVGQFLDMGEKYGKVEDLISTPTAKNVAIMAMHLLDFESKLKFKKQTIQRFDEETGSVSDVEIGGYKLLQTCMQSNEVLPVYFCVLRSFGHSEKAATKIVESIISGVDEVASEEVKKKII